MVNLGINGFGRIGRLVLRVALMKPGVDVVAINDLFMDLPTMAYLFKYDSVHGRFPGTVEHSGDYLVVDGKKIAVYRCGKPEEIPWKVHAVDVVIEATSVFAIVDRCKPHLTAGAKRVIITTPSADAPPFVCGVNDAEYQEAVYGPIISASSCTVNCLAPLLKVIDETFGVIDGTLTVLHAVASGQKAVDGPLQKDWRGGRSLLNNIIPSGNGSVAGKAVGRVLPQLAGKITGIELRVPTQNVSMVDVTVRTNRPVTMEQATHSLRAASASGLSGVLDVTDDPVVSGDFVGVSASCVVDLTASTIISPTFAKFVAWYDNEYAYACRVVDLVMKTINR